MKRIFSIAPFGLILVMCVGLVWADLSCTAAEPTTDGTTKDASTKDQAAADTSQPPQDQSAPDQAPPEQPVADQGKPEQNPPDQTPPLDQSAPDQTPPQDQSAPDQTPPQDQSSPDQTPPTDQGSPDQTPPAGITVTGSVGAPKLTGGFDPLADAKVCVYQQTNVPCVKSDSAGKFSIPGVPKNAETGLVFSKVDHVPFILTITTKEADVNIPSMLAVTPKSTLDGLSFLLGKSIDYSKGLLAGAVSDAQGNGLANATVAMTPSSGDGPYYMGASGIPDKNATATSTNGQYISINVTPGANVEIAVTHATNKSCTSEGWKGATAGTAKIPVVAGHMVAAGITCVP